MALFIDWIFGCGFNRLAHPGGAIKTNKAAALAKFLERKLQDPQGLASLNPDLIERAVKNAKHSFTFGNNFFIAAAPSFFRPSIDCFMLCFLPC